MRFIIYDKSSVRYDMHKCNIRLRLENMMKKSKTISQQTSKTTKYRIEKNSRSFSNFIDCSYENWSKFKINQHSTKSEKSETRIENAQNKENSFYQIKNFEFLAEKLKRNNQWAIKRFFRMKSRRIIRNTVNQNYALDFKIYHEWIFDRKDCFNEKHLKKFVFKTRNQSQHKRTRNSSQKRENDSSNKIHCILYRCCIWFKDKSFDCIMRSVSRFSYCIQNMKFRNRNEHKWCRIIRNWKSNKIIKNAAEFQSHMNFHR
jgi:hypothetical protein